MKKHAYYVENENGTYTVYADNVVMTEYKNGNLVYYQEVTKEEAESLVENYNDFFSDF